MQTDTRGARTRGAELGPLTELGAPVALSDRVSVAFLQHHRLCPLGLHDDGSLVVAATQGSLLSGLDDLSVAYQRSVTAHTISEQHLETLLSRISTESPAGVDAESLDTDLDDPAFTRDVRDLANQPPIVRYVSVLLRDAHEVGASDIHLEASRHGLSARYRIDGVLVRAPEPPTRADRAVVSRLKLLAELDIAERRRPQDGRLRVRMEHRELDLRVSTVPTVFGESVVLRLLERGGGQVPLAELGLPPDTLPLVQALASRSTGMFLVTGPTGSGKSTTLHSMLGLRRADAEKIVTIEDPVEYTIDGIAQVPVHAPTGVTFASVLRSVLRQDPDVILVGEMRDAETAELAVQAALTGHMLFSTLHTNDALGAIPRLLDLGVPPFLLAATLEAVLAQRLVRRICGSCRESYEPDRALLHALGDDRPPIAGLLRGRGCSACRGTGYRGRIGVFELLTISADLRDAIATAATRRQLEALAADTSRRSMRQHGVMLARDGLTTLEEVLRVTQN